MKPFAMRIHASVRAGSGLTHLEDTPNEIDTTNIHDIKPVALIQHAGLALGWTLRSY
jgi:hypothetical protein